MIRISETANGNEEIRFVLRTAKAGQYTSTQIAQMHAQRLLVERAFQEYKTDIAISEYKVRGWKAWHHHMAMGIIAQAYILNAKKLYQKEMPFLSAYDFRQVIM